MHSRPPLSSSITAKYGLVRRVFRRRRHEDIKRFDGDAPEICREVIDACWNGAFFQTSLGHFSDFWTRDTGICTGALLRAGQRERIHATWAWALERFARVGRITTTIIRNGTAAELPGESHDALPWTVRALRELDDPDLTARFRTLLEGEIHRFARSVVDTATGLLRKTLIGIRDAVRYRMSAYNVTMLGMLSADLNALGLANPFRAFDYRLILTDRYWTGTHFRADLYGDHLSSEANLFPFWVGLLDDRGIWKKTVATLRSTGLTRPYPIRYAVERQTFPMLWYNALFTPNYQGTTIWTWLGAIYLQLCRKSDTVLNEEEHAFAAMIERHKTIPELLQPDGSWYRTPFYSADDGMLWAALALPVIS